MRFIIVSTGMDINEMHRTCLSFGARNVKLLTGMKQVICDLDPGVVARLSATPGIEVKQSQTLSIPNPIKPAGRMDAIDIPAAQDLSVMQPVYAASQALHYTSLYALRHAIIPPVLGNGTTIIVMDTGIRTTHRSLRGKITLERNFTSSPTVADVFDHGTGVAYLMVGGVDAAGQESGIAPGGTIINYKILGDDGTSTTEQLLDALEAALALWEDAVNKGLDTFDPAYPNGINISAGAPDDGDPNNPIRLACKEIATKAGNRLLIYAAAGNDGPNVSTILLPAACPEVWAVGAVTFEPFEIWEKSARGPALVGNIVKPDLVFEGVNILTASCKSDNSFTVKSGTSFSCPIGMGWTLLLADLTKRFNVSDMLLNMTKQQVTDFTKKLSTKPTGSPAEMDNNYGIGMPLGNLAAQAFGISTSGTSTIPFGISTSGTSTIPMESIMSMMMMMMVMKMIPNMTKSMA